MTRRLSRQVLKRFCLQQGADSFGIADITALKSQFVLAPRIVASVTRAVSIGVGLCAGVLDDIEAAPTRLYFHHYKTTNAFLDQLALKAAHYIQRFGYRAVPIPASQILDWQTQTGHLSHKHVAQQAGVGWIGRNNLLVTKQTGSQIRLATVLTDAPLAAEGPSKDGCGSCRACVTACPCGAIKESAATFDHQACFAQLKEFQKARLVDQYVCGVCVHVCKGKVR